MELESEDGSLIKLESDDNNNNNNNKAVFGRSSGFNTNDDRTISRRHILFTTKTEPTRGSGSGSKVVSFEVVGKNPIWVRRNGKEGIRVFSRFERGEVEGGDWFCVCGQNPLWYTVKKRVELGLDDSDSDSDSDDVDVDVDVSDIDPVKVFGFLVIGHEFDQYPRRMMRNVKDWDWFLEEPRKNSDDDDGEVKRGIGRKRKKTKGNRDDDDDDWTSDEDQIAKARKVPGRKYSTRSKDTRKPRKDSRLDQLSTQRRSVEMEDNEEGDDDEEDDETLGGFIVDDNNEVEPEEESDYEEEEEEEEEDED